MKRWIAGGVIVASLLASASVAQIDVPVGPDIPRNIKPYFMVFLVLTHKGEDRASPDLMKRHLAFIRKQTEVGRYLLAGPFTDNGRIAGMIVTSAPNKKEVEKIESGDPLVMSGIVAVEVHSIMTTDLSPVRADYRAKFMTQP